MRISLFIFLTMVVLSADATAQNLTAEQILKRIDRNMQSQTQITEATMIVHSRRGDRTIKSRSYARGKDDAFTEYLYPPREKGTKMLKLGEQLWIYSSTADRVLKIAGHMLRQSVMGSDLSYEDFMENDLLSGNYQAKIVGQENMGDARCWVLQLTARKKDMAYHSRKIWVDQKRFIVLRGSRYAKSGKLLKTTEVAKVFKIDGRWYPEEIIFKDVLKKGKGTEVVINSVKFNKKIPQYLFSKASLRR